MSVEMVYRGTCPACTGSGVVRYAGCRSCNGTGTMKAVASCLGCRWMGGKVERPHGTTGGCMKTGLTVHGEWGCKDFEPAPAVAQGEG